MKVILLEDVKGIGKKEQILDASDGHAKNFLLPRKLAVEATKENIQRLQDKKNTDANRKKIEREKALEVKKQLEEKSIFIKVRLGDNGKLFGSVTSKEIAEAFFEQTGMPVDKKKIALTEPIKTIGKRTVDIKLYGDLSAKLTIEIVEQKNE